MNREQLTAALEWLAQLNSDWNDAAEDGDRGRDHRALVLVLYDGGGGVLGTAHVVLDVNVQCEFSQVEQLVEHLAPWMQPRDTRWLRGEPVQEPTGPQPLARLALRSVSSEIRYISVDASSAQDVRCFERFGRFEYDTLGYYKLWVSHLYDFDGVLSYVRQLCEGSRITAAGVQAAEPEPSVP